MINVSSLSLGVSTVYDTIVPNYTLVSRGHNTWLQWQSSPSRVIINTFAVSPRRFNEKCAQHARRGRRGRRVKISN